MIGPIETIRAAAGKTVAQRFDEVVDGRGGGEGDVVGGLGGLDRLGVGVLAHRLVEGDDVDLGAALAEGVGEDVARLGGAGDEDAAALDLDSGQCLDQCLGDEPLGDDVGGDAVLGEGSGGPGPIAATVGLSCPHLLLSRPASALASSPASSSASNSSAPRWGSVTQTSAYSRIRSIARRTSSLSIRGSIRIAGSSTTSAPRSRRVVASPLAWARARVTTTRRPLQGAALQPGERLAALHHRADDDNRRGADSFAFYRGGDRPQRRCDGALPGHRAALDRRRGLVPVTAGLDQRRRVLGHPLDAHVEDEGAGEAGQGFGVECHLPLLGIPVAGDEGDRGGVVAVGDRDPRVGGGGDAGGHAGDDLELDPGGAQRLALLAAPPEDERVAALQADDAAPARAASISRSLISPCGTELQWRWADFPPYRRIFGPSAGCAGCLPT